MPDWLGVLKVFSNSEKAEGGHGLPLLFVLRPQGYGCGSARWLLM